MTDELAPREGTPTPAPRRRPIRLRTAEDGQTTIASTPQAAALAVLGDEGADPAVAFELVRRIAALGGEAGIGLVVALEPRDAAEAMLAAQAVAAHGLAMQLHVQAGLGIGLRNHPEICRTALSASRVVGELLGRLEAGRRPAASTQKIIVEKIDGQQVAIGCGPATGGEGGGR